MKGAVGLLVLWARLVTTQRMKLTGANHPSTHPLIPSPPSSHCLPHRQAANLVFSDPEDARHKVALPGHGFHRIYGVKQLTHTADSGGRAGGRESEGGREREWGGGGGNPKP